MSRRAHRVPTILAAGALLAGFAVPAIAATAAKEPTYGHRTPQQARSAMNREQADIARRQLAENAASKQAFADAQAARDAQIQHDQQAYEAEKARLASEHEAAMARWREDAAACRAGVWAKCKHH
jgi:hypothetical protein